MTRSMGQFVFVPGLAVLLAAAFGVTPAAAQERTISDGVYTAAQATSGRESYREHCSACHASNLMGGEMAPGLAGPDFVGGWSGETLFEFADFTNATMPQDAPGRLTAEELNDIIAFILEVNEYPAGSEPLAIDLDNEGDPIIID